jgi:hypothetical protein
MKNLGCLLLLICTLSSFAQLPEEPKPHVSRKQIIISNAAMYGASVVGAHATAYGSSQCFREDLRAGILSQYGVNGAAGGRTHPWRRSFALSLPTDAAVSLTSFFLHKTHHDLLSVILPTGSAGIQIGIAGMQYAQGCF